MIEMNRLAEAEKQLGIVLEENGDAPYSDELDAMRERLAEIRFETAG